MISVIVPMYNAEKTIVRCIESILSPNIKEEEYEVILVDDGSYDNTAEICKKYAEENVNLLYFYQPNRGVSSARNFGILKATGDWIIFVDSDDIIKKNFLPLAIKRVETKSDLYILGMQNGSIVTDFDDRIITLFNDKIQLIEAMCAVKTETESRMPRVAGPVAKIYARDILLRSGICFDERISFAEDLLFNMQLVLEAEQIECINEVVYEYIDNPFSLTHTYHSTDLQHDDYFFMALKRIEKKYPELKRAYERLFLDSFLVLLGRDFGNRHNRKKIKERVNDFKNLQKTVKPYSDEDISAIFKRRKQLFVIRKQIVLYLVVHHWNYLVLLIYRIMK